MLSSCCWNVSSCGVSPRAAVSCDCTQDAIQQWFKRGLCRLSGLPAAFDYSRRTTVRGLTHWRHVTAVVRRVAMETFTMSQAGSEDPVEREPVSLTRKRSNGTTLVRRSAVETEIRMLLSRPSEVMRRAQIRDQSDPDSLSIESLTYFAREAHRAEDRSMVRVLWTAINSRVFPLVESKLRTLGGQYAADGADKVTGDVAFAIFNLDDDRGDFLQVSFWTTLQR